MKHRKPAYPVFKAYTMDQLSLIPPSWEELIPAEHIVRVVNRVIESINLEPLLTELGGKMHISRLGEFKARFTQFEDLKEHSQDM